MGRKKAAVEERVKKAARLCISNPNLPVPKAMLAEQFTLEESKDKTQQMKVRRCIKGMGGKAEVPDVVDITRSGRKLVQGSRITYISRLIRKV